MTLKLRLKLELIKSGQYYLDDTRLAFDLPYAVYIVNGDRFTPYYRVHINGELAAIVNTEEQAEDYLIQLTQEQAYLFAVKTTRTTYRTYMILFQNVETKRLAVDTFMGKTESEARKSFKECYRHGNYKLLTVDELPDEEPEEEETEERS